MVPVVLGSEPDSCLKPAATTRQKPRLGTFKASRKADEHNHSKTPAPPACVLITPFTFGKRPFSF
jgi:hypothetical protein